MNVRKIINQIPTDVLVIVTVLLGLAPFFPEPHLWEKIKMLFNGELSKPIDIFDLFMHSTPAIILLIKISMKTSNKS